MLLIAAEISELTCSKLSGSSAAVAYSALDYLLDLILDLLMLACIRHRLLQYPLLS